MYKNNKNNKIPKKAAINNKVNSLIISTILMFIFIKINKIITSPSTRPSMFSKNLTNNP